MPTPDQLEIGNGCSLKSYESMGVSISYMERQADHWYGDVETEIDIDKEKAAEIVIWLCEKYQLNFQVQLSKTV